MKHNQAGFKDYDYDSVDEGIPLSVCGTKYEKQLNPN